jgi:hypothetical protein
MLRKFLKFIKNCKLINNLLFHSVLYVIINELLSPKDMGIVFSYCSSILILNLEN